MHGLPEARLDGIEIRDVVSISTQPEAPHFDSHVDSQFGELRRFWRSPADGLARFRTQMSRRGTQQRAFAATENQGVASSNLALGTNHAVQVRHVGDKTPSAAVLHTFG